jgi:hypothetical protein
MFLKFFTSFSAVIACAESLARFQIWSSKLDPLVSTKSKKIIKIDGKPFQIWILKFGIFFKSIKNRDKSIKNLGLPFDISINHRRRPKQSKPWTNTAAAVTSKLGQGAFGPVFHDTLPQSGQPVAVKVMDAADSLQGELELSLASHLLGCAAPAHGAILLPFAYSLST